MAIISAGSYINLDIKYPNIFGYHIFKYLGLTFAGSQNNDCFCTQTVQSCSSASFLVINRGHEYNSAFPCALYEYKMSKIGMILICNFFHLHSLRPQVLMLNG